MLAGTHRTCALAGVTENELCARNVIQFYSCNHHRHTQTTLSHIRMRLELCLCVSGALLGQPSNR